MKRISFLILTVIACIMFAGDAMAAGKKVAVFVEGNLSSEQKTMVNNAVMSRLSGNKEYQAFERNDAFLRALEREHDYQLSGQVPEDQIREVGQRQGVDYVIVVVANLTRDDRCSMSARLVKLESGETLKSCEVSREFENSSTVTALANNVAYRLITKKSR